MPITKPTKSNTSDIGCSPTTSNCVTWQGPDLSCINLCAGDNVSDVVFQLATEICKLKTETDLSDLDLTGLKSFCSPQIPAPDVVDVAKALSYITKSIICLKESSSGSNINDGSVSVPKCVGGTGGTYTYSDAIGFINDKIVNTLSTKDGQCSSEIIRDLYNSVDNLTQETKVTLPNQIKDVSNRVTVIETQNIVVTKNGKSASDFYPPPSTTSVQKAVQELEYQMISVIGMFNNDSPKYDIEKALPDLAQAKTLATTFTSDNLSLSTGGTLINLGLIADDKVKGIGNMLNNIWVALGDVRSAVKIIQDNCCKVNCDSIIIDFQQTFDLVAKTLSLDFTNSIVPKGFKDTGTNISVTDVNGLSVHVTTNGSTTLPFIVTEVDTPEYKQTKATALKIPIDGLANGKLLISFKNNIGSSTVTCNDCFSKEINYVNESCCSITNTGAATVTLTIKTCS
jgi:hypothetical protein